MNLNYIVVPSSKEEDVNPKETRWMDGKCVALDEGSHITLFLGHRSAEGYDEERTEAFAVRVGKPLTRDSAINAAEMAAYGLRSAMDVASFGASMSRKYRLDPEDPEVVEHDEFIKWVKGELDAIGIRNWQE